MISVRSLLAGAAACASLVANGASAQLATSPSIFLRDQASSPVDWQPWDPALVARAKSEGKPVYLFVGSELSELSRATCRQTFANAEVAAFLNANFICVLVDREEQPAIAALAQYYLRNIKQQDGWPIHVWLTPDLQPYEGAGYLPPSEEWGKPGFLKVARQAREGWFTDPKGCRARAADAVATLQTSPDLPPPATGPALKLEAQLTAAAAAWRATYDEANSGFGSAPRGLEPELLRFLLSRPADRDVALATLRAMNNGAVRDPLDGGFFARATDAAWHLPYFQKTLADQARIALAYLDAAKAGGDAAFARAARGALDYALSRLALADGRFAAAEDDTADENAAYYVWTAAEIETVLGPDAPAFEQAYAVKADGNVSADDDPSAYFHGKNVLRRATVPGDAAAEAMLASDVARLRTARAKRPPPLRIDRATAGAHGLMLAALSRAGAQLGEPRYLEAAARTLALVQKDFAASAEGDLRHMGASPIPAGPADYAALALGCREFARTGKHPEADALATRLLARSASLFFDSIHGRYFAVPAALPPGFFVRPPAAGDPPAAETLALMAGVPTAAGPALAKTLAASLDDSTPAPGDVLLALSR